LYDTGMWLVLLRSVGRRCILSCYLAQALSMQYVPPSGQGNVQTWARFRFRFIGMTFLNMGGLACWLSRLCCVCLLQYVFMDSQTYEETRLKKVSVVQQEG
jgi:hypothetical protein